MTFKDWIRTTGLSTRAAAEVLGVSRDTVNQLARAALDSQEAREPSLSVAFQIEERTRAANPRTVVHAWELMTRASRTSIYGPKGRP